jgi:hypothetical protein
MPPDWTCVGSQVIDALEAQEIKENSGAPLYRTSIPSETGLLIPSVYNS